MVLPGCASRGGRTYKDSEVRTAQRVQKGVVADVTEVMVEDDPSLFGATAGGVAGGVLGSLLGGGRGRALFAVGGAAVGALAGAATESQLRKYRALQITVDLDGGDTLVVVQAPDESFVRGDRVRLITGGGGSARVQHI
jgi:outer membrane lipoprotein SlyB